MKLPENEATSTRGVPPFLTDEKTVNDYYPFGMTIADRSFSSAGYRYGFGGHEKDNEVYGESNHLSFNDYGYDTRSGRRWNLDPKFAKYPFQSPYSTFNCNPILFKDPSGESGEISIDANTKTITITSNIAFYGNGANTAVAKQSASDIQSAWNASAGKATIGGVQYNVKFVVTGTYIPDLTASDMAKNTDVKQNYVRVENSGLPISEYAIDGNSGFFLTSNINKDGSTTEPHEYGHGLGLWPGTADGHPANSNLIGTGKAPGIMYARGTAVDAAYTYDPSKGATAINPKTGARNNTMNPESRKVGQTDIDMLGLGKLNYIDGKANLGTTTNNYYPNNTGKPDSSPVGPRLTDGSF